MELQTSNGVDTERIIHTAEQSLRTYAEQVKRLASLERQLAEALAAVRAVLDTPAVAMPRMGRRPSDKSQPAHLLRLVRKMPDSTASELRAALVGELRAVNPCARTPSRQSIQTILRRMLDTQTIGRRRDAGGRIVYYARHALAESDT